MAPDGRWTLRLPIPAASAGRWTARRRWRWNGCRFAKPLGCGIRAIDAFLTCGRGQRLGIFGGSGVGKSTLIGMMARGTAADLTVLALVGERGREVGEFLEALGEDGRRGSVVVVSTSDQSPLLRIRAALAATSIAEYFCQLGQQCSAGHRLADALCHGAARNRTGGR